MDLRAFGRKLDGLHVLLVEDYEDAATLIADVLTEVGATVEVARTPEDAISIAERVVPTVALIDIGLPSMNGYELAHRLQQAPGWKRVPFIAMTGYARDTDRARSEAAGFFSHLVKPVSLERIVSELEPFTPES